MRPQPSLQGPWGSIPIAFARGPRGFPPLLLVAALSVAGRCAWAQTAEDSTAVVRWVAPGDDGNAGAASLYDLRFSTSPIAGADTLSWWNAATPVPGLPRPPSAGVADSAVVTGLSPSATYYFVLRVADEVPNWSGFSNVAVLPPLPDVTPPAAIEDLGVGGEEAGAPSRSPPDSARAPRDRER